MRIVKTLSLCLAVLLLVSCAAPAGQTGGEETPSVNEELVASLPARGQEGAFFVNSEEELEALSKDAAFLEYPARPALCVDTEFSFKGDVVIPRACDVYYTAASSEAWEGNLSFCFEEQTEWHLYSLLCKELLESGKITVDAPKADLFAEGGERLDFATLDLYLNAATLNGTPLPDTWGGDGRVRLSGATLTLSDGRAVEGVTLTLRANAAEVGIPLHLSDRDLSGATLGFVSETGERLLSPAGDLKEGFSYRVEDGAGGSRTYFVTTTRLSYGVPVVEIHTDNAAPIVEKNTYLPATLVIDGTAYRMQVRGRGNASWNQFPKKSYRLKLDKGASLFSLAENRDWVLSCNYADKTLIRNCVAHTLAASMSGLDYTPTHILVNLYLNGVYQGVYTFADKIEDGEGRLDLGKPTQNDMGFLIEIGWDFDEENVYNRDYFDTDIILRLFVKEPEIEKPNTREFLFVKNYILQTERAIVQNRDWEEYIDVDSFVDWFLINELTFNTESSFYRSCYMYKETGGKLKLGPVWDFDMAFGNHLGDLYGYNGFCTTESTYHYITENWMDYLLEYDAFFSRVKARWNEVKDTLLQTGMSAVDAYSGKIMECQKENFLVWDILSKRVGVSSVDPERYNTYELQVEYLRDFINTRWKYLDTRLNA